MPDEFDLAFEAKLAASDAAIEAEEETPDEPIEEPVAEAAVEETPDEQPRDDQGRFLPKFDDPDIQTYVDKYGDVNKALRAALEAQSIIGRQGQELGELRSLRQEIEQMRQQFTPQNPVPQNIDTLLEENPSAVAQWALQSGNEAVYEQAMENWFEMEPRAAARFEQNLMLGELEHRLASQIQPIAAPMQEQAHAREIVAAQRNLGSRYGDFNEILGSATEAELADFPRDVAEKVQNGTADQKETALEAIYRWVKAGRLGPMTQTDTTDAPRQADSKNEAVVVSASSSPAREGKSGVEQFKNFLLEPDQTNWRTGLT